MFLCLPADASLVELAIAASESHGIPYWDGAILAAAQSLAAPVLYSEDLNDGQLYGAFQV